MSSLANQASITDILLAPVMQSTLSNVFGKEPYDVAERPGAYVMFLEREPKDSCRRIIVLRPKGFTSNSLDVLSSHPEAREATIEIKGAVRPANRGYFPIKDCVEFVYRNKDDAETQSDYPYASSNAAIRRLKTSRTRFKVVKRNYYGFYHNLVNLTNEWLILVLDKKMNLAKQVDYSLIEDAGKIQRNILYGFDYAVKTYGDEVFKRGPGLVKRVYAMDPRISLPALITLLNVEEKGRHEQCTVFATILKIAKGHPELALGMLEKANNEEAAQPYYLRELIKKVRALSSQP